MFNLLLSLKESLMSPFRNESEGWENQSSRALLLGMPAVIVTVLAIVFLGFMQIGRKDRMEAWYTNLLETSQAQFKTQSALLAAQKNLMDGQSKPANGQNAETNKAAEIAALEKEVKLLREEEQVYLEKLIDLSPQNLEYKFQLAMAYAGVDTEKQKALLNLLAPDDRPVFFRAHKYIAMQHFSDAQRATNAAEKKLLLDMALVHADHCLIQEGDDQVAMSIKGQILVAAEKFSQAAEVFTKLFAQNPDYYWQLHLVAQKSQLPSDGILREAISKYEQVRLANTKDDTNTWVKCWQHINRCRIQLGYFEEAIEELEAEGERQTDPVRRKFVNDELAKLYSAWAGDAGISASTPEEDRRKALDRLITAFGKNPKDAGMLKMLAFIVSTDEVLGPEARKIYDPYADPNPPADVLGQLGARSLRLNDYESAIRLFDRARKKNPYDPTVLNNLAYAHLISEKGDAREALKIVNEGLKLIRTREQEQQYASHLYHTRGTALMQLTRMDDAVANFELALKYRPDSEEIVEKLAICLEGRIESQAKMYRDYLAELKARDKTETPEE